MMLHDSCLQFAVCQCPCGGVGGWVCASMLAGHTSKAKFSSKDSYSIAVRDHIHV